MIFEDNRLIGNVNLITLGSSYGIGGSTRFYRTKLEKITHIAAYFEPIRLGFWYMNTPDNYLINAIPGEGVDLEQAPHFFGGTGYMEIFYGQTKKIFITDICEGNPLIDTEILIETNGLQPIVARTDSEGFVSFEMLTVRHLKANNVITRTGYIAYTFTVAGYPDCTVPTEKLKTRKSIALNDPSCDTSVEVRKPEKSKFNVYPNPAGGYLYINGLSVGEKIHVMDATGRMLLSRKAASDKEMIPVNGFSSGYYFIRIEGVKPAETFKVFVKK
jgi:hypothetical protein